MADVAVIVAAGAGTRMGAPVNKLFLELGGKTVIEHTVAAFDRLSAIDKIIVVCREQDLKKMSRLLQSSKVSFVFGGATRQESVQNAVAALKHCDMLLIHDGARPLVSSRVILETLQKAKETGAAATGVFVKDTIKIVDANHRITATPDRAAMVAIHTPQVFSFPLYKKAMEIAVQQGKSFTDDCALVENMGRAVTVVPGDYTNIKITTPEDLPLAETIMRLRKEQP